MGAVVAGVDGSPGSDLAVTWAAGEAKRSGAELHLVHAWTLHVYSEVTGPIVQRLVDDETRNGEALLHRARAHAEEEDPGLEIRTQLVEGPAAEALTSASRNADLLVVGSRGRGGFSGLLLGSVSQQCVHHATCPVVVVPPPGRSHDPKP